jgi:hypothetical protein
LEPGTHLHDFGQIGAFSALVEESKYQCHNIEKTRSLVFVLEKLMLHQTLGGPGVLGFKRFSGLRESYFASLMRTSQCRIMKGCSRSENLARNLKYTNRS